MNRSLPTSQHPPEFPSPQRARRPESIRGSRSLLRDLNVTLVMELVRRAGAISRAELARQSQLSAPTVSTIAEKLLTRGILIEHSTAPSSGGRPPYF